MNAFYQRNPKLKKNSEFIGWGTAKTAKSPPIPPSVSFDSGVNYESENNLMDGEL
jgi:hypothetical protein